MDLSRLSSSHRMLNGECGIRAKRGLTLVQCLIHSLLDHVEIKNCCTSHLCFLRTSLNLLEQSCPALAGRPLQCRLALWIFGLCEKPRTQFGEPSTSPGGGICSFSSQVP